MSPLSPTSALTLITNLSYELTRKPKRPSTLLSQSGVTPAPSPGYSSDEDLAPRRTKKALFVRPEIERYRCLIGAAARAAAFSDGISIDFTHLAEYTAWIQLWVNEGCPSAGYWTLSRKLDRHTHKWIGGREQVEADFHAGLWEVTPGQEGLSATVDYQGCAAREAQRPMGRVDERARGSNRFRTTFRFFTE